MGRTRLMRAVSRRLTMVSPITFGSPMASVYSDVMSLPRKRKRELRLHSDGSTDHAPFVPIVTAMWNLIMSYSPSTRAQPLTICVLLVRGRKLTSASFTENGVT